MALEKFALRVLRCVVRWVRRWTGVLGRDILRVFRGKSLEGRARLQAHFPGASRRGSRQILAGASVRATSRRFCWSSRSTTLGSALIHVPYSIELELTNRVEQLPRWRFIQVWHFAESS